MQNRRAIIIEDEVLAAELIRDYIEQTPGLEWEGTFYNAYTAQQFLDHSLPHILFLDIHLPGLSGLDFLRSLQSPPHIILTTAYHQYALESYDYNVTDYLLKPIEYDRFMKAINKTKRRIDAQYNLEHIFVNVNKAQVKIVFDTITYIESRRDYLHIYLDCGKIIRTKMTISAMEKALPARFLRIHRSFIVPVAKVTSFLATNVRLQHHAIPIGRSYRKLVAEKFAL